MAKTGRKPLTNAQVTELQHVSQARFRELAESGGLLVAGPRIPSGSWLIREPDGRAWLAGSYHPEFGRTIVPSVWTEHNVRAMETPSTG